jgi:hypothetical protein
MRCISSRTLTAIIYIKHSNFLRKKNENKKTVSTVRTFAVLGKRILGNGFIEGMSKRMLNQNIDGLAGHKAMLECDERSKLVLEAKCVLLL